MKTASTSGKIIQTVVFFFLLLAAFFLPKSSSPSVQANTQFLILPFNIQDLQGTVNWNDPIMSTGIKSWFDHQYPDYSMNTSVTIYDGTVVNGKPANCTQQGTACGYYYPAKDKFVFYDGHDGIDFLLNNKPVLAAAGGKVTRVEQNDPYFGKMIEIDHKNGYVTRYGHLSECKFFCVKQ